MDRSSVVARGGIVRGLQVLKLHIDRQMATRTLLWWLMATCLALPPVAALADTAPTYVMHDMDVAIDQVAPGERARVGDHDKLRVVYDASAIDPKTRRVKLLNMQHFIGGQYQPAHPDPAFMPMDDAWLDLSAAPYAMHFRARVVHGKPILIEVDEKSRRLSIRSQDDPRLILLGGVYRIDPRPITGPDAEAAATTP